MNQCDIVHLANKHGLDALHRDEHTEGTGGCWAHEDQNILPAIEAIVAAAVAVENEACAQWCEENFTLTTGLHYAAGIRARGKK